MSAAPNLGDGALARGDGKAETHPRGCEERPGGDRQPPDHEQRQPRAHFDVLNASSCAPADARRQAFGEDVRLTAEMVDIAVPRQRSLPARRWPTQEGGRAAGWNAGSTRTGA